MAMRACPKCGEMISDSATTCPYCYESVPTNLRREEKPVASTSTSSTVVKERVESTKRCPNCWTEAPMDRQYCLKCGHSFLEDEEINQCGQNFNAATMNAQSESKATIIFDVLMILVGLLSLIFSIVCFSYATYAETFWAEGTYSRVEVMFMNIDSNTYGLLLCASAGFGFILLIIAFYLILSSLRRIVDRKKN